MTLEAQLQYTFSYQPFSCRRDQSQKAIRLLEQGANPNTENGDLFERAISFEDEALVSAFLQHGAKVTPDALHRALAVRSKTRRMTEVLLNHGADPNAVVLFEFGEDEEGGSLGDPVLYPPLMVAAEVGNTDAAKLLLERGATLYCVYGCAQYTSR